MARQRTAADVPIEVQAPRDRPRDIVPYAREQIRQLFQFAHQPVLSARVRISRHPDPAIAEPCVARACLDLNGRPVRAHAAAPTVKQAVDRVRDRLRHRLQHPDPAVGSWEERRGQAPSTEPHEWRHGQAPSHRPPYRAVPAQEREIVRHKSLALHHCNVDQAADLLEDMDYDFHLFTEVGTDQDSVIYRAGDTGYRLAQLQPASGSVADHTLPLTISPQPAPVLDTEEAIARMAFLAEPFLFYLDGERGRGAVLYRRYDGHYGLITPTE